jgi:threonine dehydratase
VDEVVLVSEEEMCGAIRLLVSEVRVIAEGAGAASTAAAMKMDLKGKTVAAMLSGRNLTAANLQTILLGGVPQP